METAPQTDSDLACCLELQQTQRIDPDDPATWPAEMQAHRTCLMARDGSSVLNAHHGPREFYQLKREVLFEAVCAELGDKGIFADAAIAELIHRLPSDTVESQLADRLDGMPQDLVATAIEVCLSLLPRLEELLPYNSGAEVLEALTADAGQAQD